MYRPNVLLVDDEGSVLFGLGHSLRGQGLRLHFAESAEEALEVLDREPMDVVISDYQMPGQDGLSFLKEVAARYPNTVRIMVSARTDVSVAVRAINSGLVFHFIEKPLDRVELRLAIRVAFAQLALQRENARLMALVRSSPELLARLEREQAHDQAVQPVGPLTDDELGEDEAVPGEKHGALA